MLPKMLGIMLLMVMSFHLSANENGCNSEPKEGSADHNVFDANGKYIGYISPNEDGSWFAWLDGSGAQNVSLSSQEAAVKTLCSLD